MQIEKRFYNEKHRPYYICAPGFTRVSNGVRAMHLLCHYLNKLGEEAYVFSPETDPKLRTPYLTQDIVDRHKATQRSPIVVYPEVVHGNPLNAAAVVRYILNHPGLLGGPKDYPESDMLVFWHQDYVDSAKYPDPSFIFIPSIDTGIFNNDDNAHDRKRDKVLVYPGRYKQAQQDYPELFRDSIVITYDWPQSHEELAALLRQGKVLYTFANSAIISEALLCGCPVVIKETVYSRKPEERAGVALGLALPGATFVDTPEGIAAAHSKTVDYQQVYHQYQLELLEQLEGFIEQSQLLPNGMASDLVLPSFQHQPVEPSQEALRYEGWLKGRALKPADAQLHAERMARSWTGQPRFIIMMPLTEEDLAVAINSVNALSQQLYKQWQLIFVADFDEPSAAFQNSEVLGWLRIDDAGDPVQLSQAYAAVLDALPCDWMAILPPGAELAGDALLSVADYSAMHPEWQVIYSDSDTMAQGSKRIDPVFRPDFNLDWLRGSDYIGPSAWFRRDALLEVGAFSGSAGADGFDAVLRIHDRCGAGAIGHIDDVLLHLPPGVKAGGATAQERVLIEHLGRLGVPGRVASCQADGVRRIHYPAPQSARLSIIVADEGEFFHLSACIEALSAAWDGVDAEILVITARDAIPAPATRVACGAEATRRERYVLGATAAKGDFLFFLDSRIELAEPEAVMTLLSLADRSDVGSVAPRLLRPDGKTIWRGPVLLGSDEGAATLFDGCDAQEPGHLRRMQVEHSPGAVLLDCLLVKRAVYQQIGGVDAGWPDELSAAADFSLKLRAAGLPPLWTPFASALRHGGDAELGNAAALPLRWQGWLGHDTAYNRHLSLDSRQAFLIDDAFPAGWNGAFHERNRVLALPGASAGVASRISAPLRKLAEESQCQLTQASVGQRLPREGEFERLAPDTVLMSARFEPAQLDWLRNCKQSRPDLLSVLLVDGLENGSEMSARYGMAYLQALAREADRVLVPTETLRRKFKDEALDVRLIPVALDEAEWEGLVSLRRTGRRPRLGWVGTTVEAEDLLLLSGVMLATVAEVDWVVLGDCPDVIKPYLAECHPYDLDSEGFPRKLASLGLDLAVLPKIEEGGDDVVRVLRMLQFGILGIPVIATAMGELREGDAPITRVGRELADWGRAVLDFARDAEVASQAGDALSRWVKANRLLSQHLPSWLQAISR
ncbi:hypothetical protein C2134_04570 [Chromobacterium sinusclupearum]|uniref:Glycosyltransferase 2-like domain-containing protein n=1 Tax=Chromobacterium sinusclupearum TaxID=2077146 RepID=A0A2K4MS90_9NEIS|nr:hypothetical protein [Chromobacterium sinusclupearum]POA99849.1 hypothetical protein C2134_04570 [Chromobacterium sinusclupearum]